MLNACSRAHRTSIADLRESLAPRQALERQPKGDKKGDSKGKKGRGDREQKGDPKGHKGDAKGKKGGKRDRTRKWKSDDSETVDQKPPWKKGKGNEGSQQAPTGKAEGKGKKPKSEIPCKFFKRGNCEYRPCEFKH